MRTLGVAAAALVLFLGGPPEGQAAATARMQVFPERPRAGELATVQLRTFSLLQGTPPFMFPQSYPWSVAAYPPAGRWRPIRLTRDLSNPYLSSATFRFSARGFWTVCVLNFQYMTDPARGCSGANPTRTVVRVEAKSASVDVWHRLQRSLRIPMIAGGTPCATSPAHGDLARVGFGGTAWGDGPAYPGLGSAERPILRYAYPIPRESVFFGSVWSGQKVLWAVDDSYRGPVLVRGLQLDGPNELRFDDGVVPRREMHISASFPPPRGRPSFTRIRAPGCYGYQVDGLGFSYVIVFQAQPF